MFKWLFGRREAPVAQIESPRAPRAPDVGDRLGDRYDLLRLLGEGGAGRVFQARDIALGTQVAIKIIPTSERRGREEGGEGGLSLKNEAMAAMRLSHRFIARTFNWERFPGCEAIIMELIPGGTLADRINCSPNQRLRIEQGIGFIIDALEGLGYAHEQDVLHNDIKPHNLLVGVGEQVKLCDFGISVGRGDNTRQSHSVAGTVTYLSPERIQGLTPDHTSDLYSIGAVLFELLAGHPPFGVGFASISGHLDSPVPQMPDVPASVAAVVHGSLAKRPQDRPTSALLMRSMLLDAGFESRWELINGTERSGGARSQSSFRAIEPRSPNIGLLHDPEDEDPPTEEKPRPPTRHTSEGQGAPPSTETMPRIKTSPAVAPSPPVMVAPAEAPPLPTMGASPEPSIPTVPTPPDLTLSPNRASPEVRTSATTAALDAAPASGRAAFPEAPPSATVTPSYNAPAPSRMAPTPAQPRPAVAHPSQAPSDNAARQEVPSSFAHPPPEAEAGADLAPPAPRRTLLRDTAPNHPPRPTPDRDVERPKQQTPPTPPPIATRPPASRPASSQPDAVFVSSYYKTRPTADPRPSETRPAPAPPAASPLSEPRPERPAPQSAEPPKQPSPFVSSYYKTGHESRETAARAPTTAPLPPPPPPQGMVRLPKRTVNWQGQAVEVPSFMFDIHPVTNENYARFVAETGAVPPPWWHGRTPPAEMAKHPVVGIKLRDARAYASWQKRRLPTASEWLAAAQPIAGHTFPWNGSCGDNTCQCPRARQKSTAAVGAHPEGRSVDGAEDLFGNVWEWTELSAQVSAKERGAHLVFGASYRHDCSAPKGVVPSTEVLADSEYMYLGFRCAKSDE